MMLDILGEEALREQWLAEDDGKEGFPDYHILQIRSSLQAILADRYPAVTGAEARQIARDHPLLSRIQPHQPPHLPPNSRRSNFPGNIADLTSENM